MLYRFDIRLSESVETDFGLGGKHYLVAALEGNTGACTQCYLLVVGILDPESKEVLWRFGDESIGGPAKVSLRRVLPSPKALSLTFQHLEGSTNWGFVRTETWIQPIIDAGGRLSFREIWSRAIEVSNAGNHGGGVEHSCGWMASGNKDGDLLFRQSAFYAEPNPCVGDDDADSIWARLPCSERLAAYRKCSTVEIERVERWVVEGDGLKTVTFKSSRIDHAESEVFPFDLPIRSSFFRRRHDSIPVSLYPNQTRLLQSPDWEYLLEFEKPCGRAEVSLFRRGRRLRTVRMQQADSFDGQADFLGWAFNSQRFFLVVRFGFTKDRALLSFSVENQDDYWEALLTDDLAEWHDGFVLEPAKPVAKRAARKAGKK